MEHAPLTASNLPHVALAQDNQLKKWQITESRDSSKPHPIGVFIANA